MGYAKLFSSILDSTVWRLSAPDRLVWITLLAMADRDGVVESSVPGLADRARVSRPECERALALLMAPDPDSRTPDHEGRRIEAVRGGWRLLNYEVYRDKQTAEEKRVKTAERQRRKRERDAAAANGVTLCHALSRESQKDTNVTPHLSLNSAAASVPAPPSSDTREVDPWLLVARGYKKRYEAIEGNGEWQSHNANRDSLASIAVWAEDQAQRDGLRFGQITAATLDEFFSDPSMVRMGWPLNILAKDGGDKWLRRNEAIRAIREQNRKVAV